MTDLADVEGGRGTTEGSITRAEEGNLEEDSNERDAMLTNDPARARAVRHALENERRLQEDLRAAGLL